jgi:hypothetical protein
MVAGSVALFVFGVSALQQLIFYPVRSSNKLGNEETISYAHALQTFSLVVL